MNIEEWSELVHRQIAELTEKYSGLSYVSSSPRLSVLGNLLFSAQYNGVSIEDEYAVEITIPEDYPKILPAAKEIGGRIPKDFHTYSDNTLCLGSPLESIMKFRKQETLLGFVADLLIPFLYGHSYKEKYGEMPYSELSHGMNGILESYKGLFHVDDDLVVIAFLKILADDNYRGHISCPCGSNAKLRNCHGNILRDIKNYQTPEEYLNDCLSILHIMIQKKQHISHALVPKTIADKMRKLSQRAGRNIELRGTNHREVL